MCLIFIAWKRHPVYRLILAANRDEFYERSSVPASFWEEAPALLAGKDAVQGGTWLGVTRRGRIAMLSNYRDPGSHRHGAPSRGALVADYLKGGMSAAAYEEELGARSHEYNGFNLIFGDAEELRYYSNRGGEAKVLTAGLYGLSNAFLDTPWPKVEQGKNEMAALLDREVTTEGLFRLLADRRQAPDQLLPQTGVGRGWERVLSARFIVSESYGTRSSTVVLITNGGEVLFAERSFGHGGVETGRNEFRFLLNRLDIHLNP